MSNLTQRFDANFIHCNDETCNNQDYFISTNSRNKSCSTQLHLISQYLLIITERAIGNQQKNNIEYFTATFRNQNTSRQDASIFCERKSFSV